MGGREEESREAGGKGRAAGRKKVGHIVRGDLQSEGRTEEGKGGKGAMVFKKGRSDKRGGVRQCDKRKEGPITHPSMLR